MLNVDRAEQRTGDDWPDTGVYVQSGAGQFGFRRTPPPTIEQLYRLLHQISDRVARFLQRRGILVRDEGSSYLTRFHGVLAYRDVGHIDIDTCERCQDPVRIIVCIEDPAVIKQILEHLRTREYADCQARLPPERAPPQIGLFDE